MIRVTASVLACGHDALPLERPWNRKVAGRTLLEHVIAALRALSELDQCFVLTDDQALLGRKEVHGAPIRPLAARMLTHSFHFLTHEYWRIHFELDALRESLPLGDVHFFLSWRTPLLTTRTLEGMYHALLEDAGAARVLPILPIDPHIHMRLTNPDRYFPVWSAPGLDRQLTPQLFRSVNACIFHTRRLLNIIPQSRGLQVSHEEGLEIRQEEDLELADFYFQKKQEQQSVFQTEMRLRETLISERLWPRTRCG